MEVVAMPSPEKFDLKAFEPFEHFASHLRASGHESDQQLSVKIGGERPTVLAVAVYESQANVKPEIMLIVKWNKWIIEHALSDFVPYSPLMETKETSVSSMWECIGKFTDMSRQAGATMLMIRPGLPKN